MVNRRILAVKEKKKIQAVDNPEMATIQKQRYGQKSEKEKRRTLRKVCKSGCEDKILC